MLSKEHMCRHISTSTTAHKNTQLIPLFSYAVKSCNPIGLKVSRKLIEKDLHDPKNKSSTYNCDPEKFLILFTIGFVRSS